MSNFNFTPTLDGLNTIEASGVSSDTIITNNFIALISAKVPTADTTSNDETATNTFFVNRAIYNESLKYVTLSGFQIINSVKQFNNLPVSDAIPTINNQLINKLYCDNQILNNGLLYVTISGNQLINGIKQFNSLPISDAIPSINNQLINKLYTDTNFLNYFNDQTISGVINFSKIPICNLNAVNNNQLVNKNYVDLKSLNYVSISGNETIYGTKSFYNNPKVNTPIFGLDAANKLYVDDQIAEFNGSLGLSGFVQLFATLAGDQTFTSGVKTFSNLPVCSVVPISSSQFVNKQYVDDSINTLNILDSISGLVTISTNQVIRSIKDFQFLPTSSVVPLSSNQFINKQYTDNNFLNLYSDNQTISGLINFSKIPTCNLNAVNNNQLVNKYYVDNSIANATISGYAKLDYVNNEFLNYLNLYNDQTISGLIIFSKNVKCDVNPLNYNDLTNKQYVDNLFNNIETISGYASINYLNENFLNLYNNSTISGNIIFSKIPTCNLNAVNNDQLVNKQYVDSAIVALPLETISGLLTAYAKLDYVNTNFLNLNSNQTVSGIINFTNNNNFLGNNNFTGNNTFNTTGTGSTIIKGNQFDCFPLITYLTSPSTTIAGNFLNCNSIQNWLNGEYTNLNSSIQTTMRSPLTLISSECKNFNFDSSNILISSATRNLNINCEKMNINSIITVPDLPALDNTNRAVNSKFVNEYAASISLLPLNNTWTGMNTFNNTTTISGALNVKSDLITLGSETNTSKINIKQNTAALNPGNIGYSFTISGSLTWSSVGSLNYFNVGSFQMPPYQVSLISLSVQFILNSSQTISIHGSVVSESATVSAIPSPIIGGFYYASQADIPLAELAIGTPAAVAPLCGVYNNGTSSSITLYVKAQLFQSYTVAPRVSYIGTVSKIG